MIKDKVDANLDKVIMERATKLETCTDLDVDKTESTILMSSPIIFERTCLFHKKGAKSMIDIL